MIQAFSSCGSGSQSHLVLESRNLVQEHVGVGVVVGCAGPAEGSLQSLAEQSWGSLVPWHPYFSRKVGTTSGSWVLSPRVGQ